MKKNYLKIMIMRRKYRKCLINLLGLMKRILNDLKGNYNFKLNIFFLINYIN